MAACLVCYERPVVPLRNSLLAVPAGEVRLAVDFGEDMSCIFFGRDTAGYADAGGIPLLCLIVGETPFVLDLAAMYADTVYQTSTAGDAGRLDLCVTSCSFGLVQGETGDREGYIGPCVPCLADELNAEVIMVRDMEEDVLQDLRRNVVKGRSNRLHQG